MQKKCVIFLLKKNLRFLQLDHCPNHFLDEEGSRYYAVFKGDDNGFYDWLRNSAGRIIGVRWFPYDGFELQKKRVEYLRMLDYVTTDNAGLEMSIYFSKSREFDESKSHDQDFCGNNFYYSNRGICAVSFSIGDVTEWQSCILPMRAEF